MMKVRYWAFNIPEVIAEEVAEQRHHNGAGYRVQFLDGPIARVSLTVYANRSLWVQVRDDLVRNRWSCMWSQENRNLPDGQLSRNYLAQASCFLFNAGNDSVNYDGQVRIIQRNDGLRDKAMIRIKPAKQHVVRSTGVPLVRLDPPRFSDYADYLDFDYRGFMNIDRDIAEEFFPGGEIPPVCGLR